MDGVSKTYTSLHRNLAQADLDFLIFVQRNKTDPALCNLPILYSKKIPMQSNPLLYIGIHSVQITRCLYRRFLPSSTYIMSYAYFFKCSQLIPGAS
ncbi:MAG TPA: hypothetical protein DDY23_07445 [Lachnospiraceae bacterium]|nr:hypothetical protein [Lachnospiraceae bacterium]